MDAGEGGSCPLSSAPRRPGRAGREPGPPRPVSRENAAPAPHVGGVGRGGGLGLIGAGRSYDATVSSTCESRRVLDGVRAAALSPARRFIPTTESRYGTGDWLEVFCGVVPPLPWGDGKILFRIGRLRP